MRNGDYQQNHTVTGNVFRGGGGNFLPPPPPPPKLSTLFCFVSQPPLTASSFVPTPLELSSYFVPRPLPAFSFVPTLHELSTLSCFHILFLGLLPVFPFVPTPLELYPLSCLQILFLCLLSQLFPLSQHPLELSTLSRFHICFSASLQSFVFAVLLLLFPNFVSLTHTPLSFWNFAPNHIFVFAFRCSFDLTQAPIPFGCVPAMCSQSLVCIL